MVGIDIGSKSIKVIEAKKSSNSWQLLVSGAVGFNGTAPEKMIAEDEFAKAGEKLFRENPFTPQLKTHKLHGRDKEVWAFSVSYRHRIKFIFLKEDSVLFLDVGTHNQVY